MPPRPSPTCDADLQNYYNISKILGRKKYVPNLSVLRKPKVNTEDNEEAQKSVFSLSAVRHKYSPKKEVLRGPETFAAHLNTSNSGVSIGNGPKITDLKSNYPMDAAEAVVSGDESSTSSSMTSKSDPSTDVSDPISDLPIAIPRPRLSLPNDQMDFFNIMSIDEPIFFLLKIPKYLPGVIDGLRQSEESSKNETQMCTLRDLPEGQIGTLQILKSNRLRLVIGQCAFSLDRGVRVGSKEELVFINTDTKTNTGEVVSLGEVKGRMITVPESVTTLANDDGR